MQLASDTSYFERTNLQQILQNHNTLESELSSNSRRVEDAVLQGRTLVQEKNFASRKIEQTINAIQNSWSHLNETAKDRGRKLHQASEKKGFDWSIEDFLEWLSNVEKALASEDLGQDLKSVNSLIKKQSLLEADVLAHRERLNDISRRVQKFKEIDHFQLDEITQKANEVTKR